MQTEQRVTQSVLQAPAVKVIPREDSKDSQRVPKENQ